MSMRRGYITAVALLAFGVTARADYSYTSVFMITSSTIPAGDAITLTGAGPTTLHGSNSISLGSIMLTSTNTTPGTATVSFTDTVTITNPFPGGAMNTFSYTGTVTVSNLTSTSSFTTYSLSAVTPSTPLIIGGASFDLVGVSATTPTVNGTNGAFGAAITTTVPEPGSMALIGIGLTGMLGYGWRRREVARRSNLG